MNWINLLIFGVFLEHSRLGICFDQVYLEYWKEIRIQRQTKFHHIIGFRIIPDAATGCGAP